MSQQLQKLTSDLEAELNTLKQQTESAERRKAQAENIASSLEQRNKQQIATIDAEVKAYKEESLRAANDDIDQLKLEMPKLQSVKQQLIEEIETLVNKQAAIIEQQEGLVTEHDNLVTSVEQLQAKLSGLDSELIEALDILADRQGKVGVMKQEIKELNYTLEQMANDKDSLQTELDNVGASIAEQSAFYLNEKTYKDNELYELNEKIRKAQISLKEAELKDKAMRSQWAEEKMKLDKRTQVVQRMEARVSDAESRIEELNRFGAL